MKNLHPHYKRIKVYKDLIKNKGRVWKTRIKFYKKCFCSRFHFPGLLMDERNLKVSRLLCVWNPIENSFDKPEQWLLQEEEQWIREYSKAEWDENDDDEERDQNWRTRWRKGWIDESIEMLFAESMEMMKNDKTRGNYKIGLLVYGQIVMKHSQKDHNYNFNNSIE